MRVIDGLIAVFCSVGGVEPQSEMVWGQADRYKVPRIAFVNKMDRVGADFHFVVKQMKDRLDANPVPFQIPIGKEDKFLGTICLIEKKAVFYDEYKRIEKDIPQEYMDRYEEGRHNLIEKLADYSDELMELYLEEKEIPDELLYKVARYATLKLYITPVFCGSAYKNKGVRLLLDAVVNFLPSPMDVGAILGTDPDEPERNHKRGPSIHSPFSALAFKIIHDPYVGQQTFIRVYSGILENGMTVLNTTKNKRERVGRIYKIHAKDHEEVEKATPGDIVALVGMKHTKTGCTLSDPDNPILLEKIHIPQGVINLRVSPANRREDEKMGAAFRKLAMEDPSFELATDEETGESIITGMGELHLEVLIERLRSEFGVDVQTGEPSVAFRETITQEANTNYRYVKQTGGKGQFAHVVMRLEPNQGHGFEFVEHIKGGNIPSDYIPSIEKGIRETLEQGVLADFPVVDVRCVLLDGSYHEVDSSEMAFAICGSMAFKEAFRKAAPILLEPVMKVEINTPDDYIGDVVKDIARRRGQMGAMEKYREGAQKVNAVVPLREMFGYATNLRNITSGRASFSMEFRSYDPMPSDMLEKVLADIAKKKAEDGK